MREKSVYFILSILSAIFLCGCGAPIQFSADSEGEPSYVSVLDSRGDDERKKVNRKTNKSDDERKKVNRKTNKSDDKEEANFVKVVTDTLVSKPLASSSERKPEWVQNLTKEVTPSNKIKLRKTPTKSNTPVIKEDLVSNSTTDNKSSSLRPLDIVFVIDSSSSMYYYLRKMGNNFRGFIPALNVDWRIIFITAGYGGFFSFLPTRKGKAMRLEKDGRILYHHNRYLTKEDPDHETIFIDTLRSNGYGEYVSDNRAATEVTECSLPPHCQGGNERPLKSLASSFTKNYHLFRHSANVAAVIITDSDEGLRSSKSRRTKPEDVISAFRDKWGNTKRFISYGIIMQDIECLDKKYWFEENVFGRAIAKLSDLTGGKNYSICSRSHVSLAKQIVSDFKN